MKKKYFKTLESSELFRTLTQPQLQALFHEHQVHLKSFSKQSIIHLEQEQCHFLDVILEGKVTVQQIDINGNILNVTSFSSGDNLGGNILFSRLNHFPMMVIASTDVKILQLSKEVVLRLCQEHSEFLEQFLMSISDKSYILTQKIKVLSKKSIREMCIDFIEKESIRQNNQNVKLTLTKKEIAEKLGIQRTSLSRVLTQLQEDGFILYDAKNIQILKPLS